MAVSDLSDKYITRARPDANWSYRFDVRGTTYKGPTDTTGRAEAKRIAKDKRDEIIAQVKKDAKLGRQPLTFGRAVELFIAEVVPSYLSFNEADARRETDFMLKYIKAKHELHAIPASEIKAMALARADCLRKGRGGIMQKITPSTVNATVDLLHRILSYAGKAHDATMRQYDWTAFRVKRQKRQQGDMIKRAIKPVTEQTLLAAIHPKVLQVTRFALLSGLRANENLLRWDQIDWEARMALDVRGKGRRERGRDVRLGRAAMAILQAEYNQPDRHPVYVFTYHAARTKHVNKTGRKLIRGSRYPITYSYWNTAWDRALAKLGMQGKVRLHDWRHTFATRLANSVNARNVQAAMDHAKIETTMGYISVDDDAIRAALDDTPMPMPLMPNDGVAPISAPKNKRFG